MHPIPVQIGIYSIRLHRDKLVVKVGCSPFFSILKNACKKLSSKVSALKNNLNFVTIFQLVEKIKFSTRHLCWLHCLHIIVPLLHKSAIVSDILSFVVFELCTLSLFIIACRLPFPAFLLIKSLQRSNGNFNRMTIYEEASRSRRPIEMKLLRQ